MVKRVDWEAREAKLRASLLDQAERAIKQRSKDREFHGLEREFRYYQAQMSVDFAKTKDVKHPRDAGSAREQILRKFLAESGYLPARYAVSGRSIRVASTTGHLSQEIDIALYDPQDSMTLMNRENVYQVLPIESVYGVIQVKSRLNRTEVREGLANLASFKRLRRATIPAPMIRFTGAWAKEDHGFGLLFAFDSDLKWANIIQEIEEFAGQNSPQNWANGVFILNRGFFLHGGSDRGVFQNKEIEGLQSLVMHGYPDREGRCLYQFQSLLLALLRNTEIHPAAIDPYFRLPLIADEHSYSFSMGQFAEIGRCEQHGDYQRKIPAEQLAKVIKWCRGSEPINWVRATHQAFGMPEDEAAYARQPGDVYIYNPSGLLLKDILTHMTDVGGTIVAGIGYDIILTAGMTILIPYYYSLLEGIINTCPKCPKVLLPDLPELPGDAV